MEIEGEREREIEEKGGEDGSMRGVRGERQTECICLCEIERNREGECYVLGDRKQERAMRMQYGRQDKVEGRDVVSRGE